jgi:hypothetical protein
MVMLMAAKTCRKTSAIVLQLAGLPQLALLKHVQQKQQQQLQQSVALTEPAGPRQRQLVLGSRLTADRTSSGGTGHHAWAGQKDTLPPLVLRLQEQYSHEIAQAKPLPFHTQTF